MRDLDDVTVAVTSILPLVMIVLAALSSFVYATNGEWRRATYWAAAAVITWSVL